MISLYVSIAIVILLLAAVVVLFFVFRQGPESGEVLVRLGVGKSRFSATPRSKIFCWPGIHSVYQFPNKLRTLELSNYEMDASQTRDGLSVFYRCEIGLKLILTADALTAVVLEDDSANLDGIIESRVMTHVRSIIRTEEFKRIATMEMNFAKIELTELNQKISKSGYFVDYLRIHSISLEPSDGIKGNVKNYEYIEQEKEDDKRRKLLAQQQSDVSKLKMEIEALDEQLADQLSDTRRQQQEHFNQIKAKSNKQQKHVAYQEEQRLREKTLKITSDVESHHKREKEQLEANLRTVRSEQREMLEAVGKEKHRREELNAERHKRLADEELAQRERALDELDSDLRISLEEIDKKPQLPQKDMHKRD